MITNHPNAISAGSASIARAKHFRRLKAEELVSHGDFVADGRRGFEPWEGPGGFRADSFVKPIYRKHVPRPTGAKKLQ